MTDTTYFAAKFNSMTIAQIDYALTDIKETLDIWRDQETDYTRKLWAEWDYLIVRKQKMGA
jgi:glutathione synthase/RimK-type ligase-like ATP-grasp enzyme